jgi:hypothetical protein
MLPADGQHQIIECCFGIAFTGIDKKCELVLLNRLKALRLSEF